MRFNVLRFALECLSAERLAIETHIVEVCSSIINDVKAIRTRLVPRKAYTQAVTHIYKFFASRHSGKASAAYLLASRLGLKGSNIVGFSLDRLSNTPNLNAGNR